MDKFCEDEKPENNNININNANNKSKKSNNSKEEDKKSKSKNSIKNNSDNSSSNVSSSKLFSKKSEKNIENENKNINNNNKENIINNENENNQAIVPYDSSNNNNDNNINNNGINLDEVNFDDSLFEKIFDRRKELKIHQIKNTSLLYDITLEEFLLDFQKYEKTYFDKTKFINAFCEIIQQSILPSGLQMHPILLWKESPCYHLRQILITDVYLRYTCFPLQHPYCFGILF